MGVNIDTGDPQPQQGVNPADTVDFSSPMPDSVAIPRAKQAAMGLRGAIPDSFEDIYNKLKSGLETDLRTKAAAAMDVKNADIAHKKMMDLLSGGNVNDPDQIRSFLQAQSYSKVDPESVIEKGYGKAAMDNLSLTKDTLAGGNYAQAFGIMPDFMDQTQKYGQESIAKHTYAKNTWDNGNIEAGQESWGEWGWNTLKEAFPGYSESVLRSVIPGGGFFEGGGIGNHLDILTRKHLGLPFEQFKKVFDETYAALKEHDPNLAQRYARAVMGSSTSDIIADNLGSVLDAGFLAGGIAGSKSAVKMVQTLKSARQAIRDVTIEAMHPDATPSTMANAAGDADRASITLQASNMYQEAKGAADQTKQILDQTTSNFKTYDQQMRQNAGQFGQEGVNRFIERRQKLEDWFLRSFGDMFRVDRLPELDTMRGLAAFKEWFKKDFKTPSDAIVDSKMHYEPFTGTRWGELLMGKPDGTFWDTIEGIQNWAKQHGLSVRVADGVEQDIDKRMAELEERLRNPPEMADDVHGLNNYYKDEAEYDNLKMQKQAQFFSDRGDVWTIKPQGQSFYLSLVKPIDETRPWVENLIKGAPKTRFWSIFNPKSYVKTQAGRIRTGEELLSDAENQERKFATHGPTQLTAMFEELSKAIDDVPGKHWDQFKKVLDQGRKMLDGNNEPGYWFKNPGELENYYVHNFNRVPTPEETTAYFTYVRNYEIKRVIEAAELYKFKARLGAEQHRIVVGKAVSSWFDGTDQKGVWPGSSTDVVMFVDPRGKTSFAHADQMVSGKEWDAWKKLVASGAAKVIRIFDPDAGHLNGFLGTKGERVRYVITRNSQSQPLDLLSQVGKKEGGHFKPEYDHYLKQADMHYGEGRNGRKIWTYRGDITAAAIPIRAIGVEMEQRWNAVRQLLADNKLEDAEALHKQTMPGDLDFKTFKSWFDPSRDEKGRITGPARFRKDEPFRLVEKDKSIYHSDRQRIEDTYGAKGKFVDGTTTGSDAQQYRVAYTQERDAKNLHAINDVGTQGNPVYRYEPAALADPIQTYNRATAQLVKSAFFNDYKILAYRHFLENALRENLLTEPASKVMSAYFHYFHEVPWRTNLSAQEQLTKQNLLNAYHRINDFTGLMSDVERQMFSLKQNMLDSVYNRLGPKFVNLTDKDLALTRDPTAFIRNVTYHAFLGLFHIPAFFTQLSTALNVHAISPRSALASTAAALLHNWSRINMSDEILRGLDDKISRLQIPGMRSFRPGEWREAHTFFENTGFFKIGGEQGMLDDPTGAKMFGGIFRKVLDWGSKPFEEGARWTRMAAGYSAYLERRELFGPGMMGRQDWAWILDRAADLDHNMSRASNSALHTGWASLAGQFQTYALRLNELMTGKRLTAAEKIRLFTMTSIMYGIPSGGLGLFLWPFSDSIRQSALSGEGFGPGGVIPNPFPQYNPGEHPFYTGVMEGLPNVLVQYLTSDGKDWRTGSQLDIRKWGPEQFEIFQNAINGEGVMKTLMGPAAGELANIWAGASPLRQWVVSVLNPGAPYYPPTMDDFLEPLKAATSTGGKLAKLYTAWHTQRLISNRGTYLGDVTMGEALANGILGLQPTSVKDVSNKEAILKWRKAFDQETVSEAGREVQKALMADDEGDNEQRDKYFIRANAIFKSRGYPEEKISQAMANLIRDYTSLPERLDYQINVKTARDKIKGVENYKRLMEMQELQKKGRKR